MSGAETDGGLWVEYTAGQPSPAPARVVFVHGSMDRGAAFVKVSRRLGELDRLRYDRRGYGRSRTAGLAGGLEGHVSDLLAVMGGRPSVVVGHSLGGVIALVLAERHPELVRALAVVEAPMPWKPWWPGASAGSRAVAASAAGTPDTEAAELFMRHIVGEQTWERLPERTRAARRAEGPALLDEIRSLRAGSAPFRLERITVPMLVARGTLTGPHHLRATGELATSVPGARLWEIEGAGHGSHTSHPDGFAALVRATVTLAGPGPGVTLAGPGQTETRAARGEGRR